MTPDDVYSFVRTRVRETGEPIVTSSEVAAEFDTAPKTAKTRLNELVEQGRLGVKEIGGRGNGAYYLKG